MGYLYINGRKFLKLTSLQIGSCIDSSYHCNRGGGEYSKKSSLNLAFVLWKRINREILDDFSRDEREKIYHIVNKNYIEKEVSFEMSKFF